MLTILLVVSSWILRRLCNCEEGKEKKEMGGDGGILCERNNKDKDKARTQLKLKINRLFVLFGFTPFELF